MFRHKIFCVFLTMMLVAEMCLQGAFSTSVDAAGSFYESFDNYTDATLTDVWTTNIQANLSADTGGKIGRCLKVTSSNTERINIARKFGVLNENRLKIEFYIKGDAQTKLCFTDSGGGDIYVLSWEGKEMSYSQTGANRFAKLDEISLNRMPNEWNKIKLYIDNTANKYTVVSGSGMAEKSFNASLGSICGVKFITSKALSKNICIDELVITNFENIGIDSAKASFLNGTESSSGAAFIYNDDITDDGLELKCATPDDNGYYSVKSDKGIIKIDLDGDTALNCGNGKNVFIDVKYKDEGYGWFYLRYKTVDGEQANTKEVCLYNSGDTITKKFTLCDAAVNSADNGADLTILTHKFEKDANNANGFDNSCYPVNIYEINIYSDETYSPIDVTVNTNNVGNIFYDNDTPSFKVELTNKADTAQSFSLAYSINKYNREMSASKTDEGTKNITLNGGASSSLNITAPNDDYGLYNIEIDIYNSSNIKQETITVPFSRCIKNTQTNASMGTNLHVSRPNNADADTALYLMKSAGIDSARDTIDWYRYEKSPGVYKLTNEQEKLLDAAKKYGTDVLLIPLGRNGIYDGMLSKPKLMTKEAAVHYGNFVYNLLKEEKVRRAVDRIVKAKVGY